MDVQDTPTHYQPAHELLIVVQGVAPTREMAEELKNDGVDAVILTST